MNLYTSIKCLILELIHLLIVLIFIVFLLLSFLYTQTNRLSLPHTPITSAKIPSSFDGYRIIQLTDLHSKTFGYQQAYLINSIKLLKPDLIVITGDLIDGKTKLQQPCLQLLEALPAIAPTYYVYGNHESPIMYNPSTKDFFNKVNACSIHTLYNETITLTSPENESINLIGITDPTVILPNSELVHVSGNTQRIFYSLDAACRTAENIDRFNILLAHRPEFLSTYAKFPIDLALCGHVHGGQIRLPFVGGLYSSDQGFFPKYDAGAYYKDNTTMLVGRGLGTGTFPIRLFNLPEIHLITPHSIH